MIEKAMPLPSELVDLVRRSRGNQAAVDVPSSVLEAIDEPFRQGLAQSLKAIRDHERSTSVDLLNLRVR